MIAGPNQHYDSDTLQRLLDDELPHAEVDRVEFHLSGCDQCRLELEEIAGHSPWWQETVDILSSSTVSARSSSASNSTNNTAYNANESCRPSDASMDWIKPLLEKSDSELPSLGRIDQYEILEVIGQGGMGVVLRGLDPALNRPVAIKVLSPHLAGMGAARARFMREAQAAATIVHPSIVPIYSVVTSARLPYLVMPCIHGGNLQQRIDREGPLDLAEVLRIGVQVAEGLGAAHRQSVIHRDIKPANILMEEGNGRVLISDFGLARALDDASLTMSGMIAGTPQYMSPEQTRGEMIDARTDLFSLGSLLYALATGRPPYRADCPLAVLRKISDSRPKPIHHVNELIPQWFDALVGRLMTIDAGQRIPTAEAAANLLREAHLHVRNPSTNPLPEELTSRRVHRLTIVVAILAACLVPVSAYSVASRMLPMLLNPAPINAQESSHDDSNLLAPATIPEPVEALDVDWYGGALSDELRSIEQSIFDLQQAVTSSPEFIPHAIDSSTESATAAPNHLIEQP